MICKFCLTIQTQLNVSCSEACVLFRAGAARDGYFTNDDLTKQVSLALDIFEEKHPGVICLLLFDNATTHQKRPLDGLSARHMVLNPKHGWTNRTSVKMRNGKLLNGSVQHLYHADEHPKFPGWFKGMHTILQERGLWRDRMKAQCKDFKCTDTTALCCARRILFNQPDFASQQSLLEEIITKSGHLCDFYPKFHYEFNFIEMYWGAAKWAYRLSRLTSGTEKMESNVLRCLDSVPALQILR